MDATAGRLGVRRPPGGSREADLRRLLRVHRRPEAVEVAQDQRVVIDDLRRGQIAIGDRRMAVLDQRDRIA